MSKLFTISSGVPQGFHLGPVLFTVFINDLPETYRSSTDIYADDTLLHQTIGKRNSTDLDKLQESVTNASHDHWAHSWRGQFCPGKTVLRSVGQTATTVSASTAVVIEDEPIQVVTLHKHLGLTISPDLCWSSHIENILQKADRQAGLLRHMSRQIPADTLAQLYLSYVRPTIEYASQVWHGSITTDQALSLERVQAAVAGPMPTTSWLDDTEASDGGASRMASTPLAESSCKHNPLPSVEDSATELVRRASSSHIIIPNGTLPPKSEQLLLPKLRTKRLSNSFFYHASLLWNLLPANIQNLQKSEDFKSAVEQHWAALKFRPSADIPLPAMNWRHFFLPSPLQL